MWTERDIARRAAWGLTDEHARADALVAVKERFGPAQITSTTTATFRRGEHPTERAAAQQEREFAAARAAGAR